METRIHKIRGTQPLGHFRTREDGTEDLAHWTVEPLLEGSAGDDMATMRFAASQLQHNDTPIGFPTETVYGLGADATRSAAVRGIYAAKGRPSDNPLIVHVCDLTMLRTLLVPSAGPFNTINPPSPDEADPIPQIYRPLIERFWPGPLTILLPLPHPSPLAPEVTAGLPTFGARMPASPLARTLIALARAPLAAPSANASTRPSPTTAAHVAHDLAGRIAVVLDGGACGVGVESTVVDGLSEPPAVLRPGGVGIEALRGVKGWEGVVRGYVDAEEGGGVPRAPGMKYKHYSPRARVVLFEAGVEKGLDGVKLEVVGGPRTVGFIRTRRWETMNWVKWLGVEHVEEKGHIEEVENHREECCNGGDTVTYKFEFRKGELEGTNGTVSVLDINLGQDTRGIAQGLFSALRDLDMKGADIIFVEGIDDGDDIAAAVMNRLRKAASEIRT